MNPTQPSDSTGELLGRCMHDLRRRWSQAAAPFGLSPHQVRALRVIGREPLRPGELADHLRVVPRSATDVIDALEKAELIARTPDPSDRRATIVTLTGHGRKVLDEVSTARDHATENLLSKISLAERAQLDHILRALITDIS